MKSVSWLLSLSLVGLASACEYETFNIQQAHMRGELGEVTNIDDPIDSVRGTSRDGYTSLRLTSEPGSDAAMMIVNFNEGIYALQEGTSERFGDWESGGVTVVGCSGPDVGTWDYDKPAEEVVVTVEADPENPDLLMYAVSAVFPGETGFWDGGLEETEAWSTFLVPRDPLLLLDANPEEPASEPTVTQ